MMRSCTLEKEVQKRWSLFSGVLIMMAFGSSYSISAWNAHFKEVLHLTSGQISTISALSSFGMYLSLVPGIFYDTFGVQNSIALGGLGMSLCYLYLYLSVSAWSSVAEWTRSLAFFFNGLCGGLLICSVLGSNEGLHGVQYRGTIIGGLMAAFSFGGALYTSLYQLLFQPNVAAYFLFLCINLASVCLLGVFLLLPSHFTGKNRTSADRQVLLGPKQPRSSAATIATNITGYSLFARREYWLLAICMVATIGGALLVMTNMAFIVESAGGQKADVPYYVASFSLVNLFGRLGAGWAMDYTYHSYPRTAYLNLALVLALLSYSLFLIVPASALVLPIWLAGLQEGCMFSIFPVLVRELFGPLHYGKNFGFMSLANALGYPLFLQPISAFLYQHFAIEEKLPGEEAAKCIGQECFGYMFALCIVLCVMGLVAARRF